MDSIVDGPGDAAISPCLNKLQISTPTPCFTDKKSIVDLDFHGFDKLPPEILGCERFIKVLSLKGNDLCSIEGIEEIACLEELYISENEIQNIPESFCKLEHLRVLHCVGNNLLTLPEQIGNLKALENLQLDENVLTILPDSLTMLPYLHNLDLNINKLSLLPQDFGNLSNLTTLNLSDNHLSNLPESFAMLKSITALDLSDNKLSYLPENCMFSNTLESLYVERNELQLLPYWINNVPSCERISFRDNQIISKPFTEEFGDNNQSVIFLDITGNYIEELPSTIGGLNQLDILKLGSTFKEIERNNFQNGNWIRYIPESFVQLSNLTILLADENHIRELPDDFGDLRSLKFLDLGMLELYMIN